MRDDLSDFYDVVVIGGGAAGLSGALMLARSRRSVLVVDAGEPRNAPAAGVHGFLSRDGIAPAALMDAGRAEVGHYGGQVTAGRVVAATREGDGFAVDLEGGARIGARRLLVATGLVDELPDVPGLRERWGRDVLHCPYCHGWEVRDQAIGVLATGAMAIHQAQLFRQLTDELTFFRHTGPEPAPGELDGLAARGVRIVEGQVVALEVAGDALDGVRLDDGSVVPVQALAIQPRFVARAGFLAGLGLEPVEHPRGMGEHLVGGLGGVSDVPGVWVAGNVADLGAQVVGAADAGVRAGAMINADLAAEDTRLAVGAAR